MWQPYEHRSQPVISMRLFLGRVGRHFLLALAIVIVSLIVGTMGYRVFARFEWIDSFLNAAMLLGGMGPIGEIPTTSGKLFAGIYALYAGLVLIAASGVLLAPVLHRLLHRLHVEGGGTPG
ncbi:MAG TPA: hypothetical protein VGM20_06760 [Gemmatimonadales bacterium]|jgi:hypothetical protein